MALTSQSHAAPHPHKTITNAENNRGTPGSKPCQDPGHLGSVLPMGFHPLWSRLNALHFVSALTIHPCFFFFNEGKVKLNASNLIMRPERETKEHRDPFLAARGRIKANVLIEHDMTV